MQQPARGFVCCRSDPTRFEEPDGSPFYFAGANCYYLLTRGADPALRHECTAVLDAAAAAGLTVLRTWAFADGASQWNALQPSPGVFDERVFRSLDWLLAEAAARGLRLLLVLTNYWKDYGGMRQYVAWACQQRGQQPPQGEGREAEPFYLDPDCQRMFRCFLAAMVHRKNSVTGVMYRDDPTILAWGLANEPRCTGDAACTTIPCWAAATAAYVKSLDPNHMITVDTEGFLGPATPDACCHNPYNCAGSGCNFAADCGGQHIDFACCHLYPELWRPQAGAQDHLRWSLAWLDCHVALSWQRLRKPLVLTEFGKRRRAAGDDGWHRAEWYSQVLARVLHHMRAGSGLAGSAFWLLAAPSYPDHDGFTVYFNNLPPSSSGGAASAAGRVLHEQQAQQGPGSKDSTSVARHGSRTADVIWQHAAEVDTLNHRRPQQPQPQQQEQQPQQHPQQQQQQGSSVANPLLGPSGSGGGSSGATGASAGGVSSATAAGCFCCPLM